jgi:hypothetical protein
MTERVEFTLTMPNVGSWNGRWSGEGKHYTIVRRLTNADVNRLGLPQSWYHNFGDGWGASVSARVLGKGERPKRSAGFCGYDWMVDRILRWGDTHCRCEWKLLPDGSTYGPGEWERCLWCKTTRRVKEVVNADA